MELQKRKEILDSLNNKLKRKKYISLLLALFTLGVNIFAWFVFSSSVGMELDGSVAAWDIQFSSENQELNKNVIVNVTNMKPGMPDFNKTFLINNSGDVEATFTYNITSITMLGKTVNINNKNSANYFNTYFPFKLDFVASKDVLGNNDSLEFTVNLKWPYDSPGLNYYPQGKFYSFNPTFSYYSKNSNGTYYLNNSIDSSSKFNSDKDYLYLEKDDADSFFGMECKKYEETSGTSCLKINIKLIAEQNNSNK